MAEIGVPGGPRDGEGWAGKHPVNCRDCPVVRNGPNGRCWRPKCRRALDDHQYFADHDGALCPE